MTTEATKQGTFFYYWHYCVNENTIYFNCWYDICIFVDENSPASRYDNDIERFYVVMLVIVLSERMGGKFPDFV